MRENTPPASPFHDENDELIYVGDDIDEVIEQLEAIPDRDEDEDEIDEEGKFLLSDSSSDLQVSQYFRRGHGR